jgi:hypothetical protein
VSSVRRTTRRLAAVGAATFAAGSAFAAWAPAADAVSGIQTGYWSALPASPQVPSGGYEVGSNASGAHAVAALRFTLGQGESATKLVLKVAQAEPAEQVSIEACPVAAKSASWTPPSGGGAGALSAAPVADCSNGVAGGSLSADGTTMTFDLSLLNFTGIVDLLLQPSQGASAVNSLPGAPSQGYPTFDTAFDQLTAAQISIETAPVTAPVQAPQPATQGNNPAPAPAPSAAPPVASVPLPPTTAGTTTDAGGAAPVIATPQQSPVAQASPALVTHHRNLRLLFAIAMLSSDLLFLFLWLQHHQAENDVRPKLSIYDPPPAATSTP